ncbi:MAG: hypothetical protein AABZ74_06185 [Cyanobacteriota bacterium]
MIKKEFIWEKQGLIFAPDNNFDWMSDYAQNPSSIILNDRIRVFFNCRPKKDKNGYFSSYIAYVDLDINNLFSIINISKKPLLEHGSKGCFDEHGTMCGNVVEYKNNYYMYYVGWQRLQSVPYTHSIGLAISKDNCDNFEKIGKGPVISKTVNEPFLQNSPFISIINKKFQMWYSSGLEWVEENNKDESIYLIMHSESEDGINWQRNGVPIIETVVDFETQTNPSVIEIDGIYHMWFCYRHGKDFRNKNRGYKIGYAYSEDLINWKRDDKLGANIPLSEKGWDSEMLCYPYVIEYNKNILMFYSGNFFGRDGFGYAILKDYK